MNARTIVSLGVLSKYRPDTSPSIDRDMKIMRESATAVFHHVRQNLEGIFGEWFRHAANSLAQI